MSVLKFKNTTTGVTFEIDEKDVQTVKRLKSEKEFELLKGKAPAPNQKPNEKDENKTTPNPNK